MGRIRTIKPEFFTDEELSALPEVTHHFAAGLLCYSDDEGYFNANPGLIKAAVFPLREPSVSVQVMLTQLSESGFIQIGITQDGKAWGRVVKFNVHQRVNRPTPSKISILKIVWPFDVKPHVELTEDSLPEGKGKEVGTEGNGGEAPLAPLTIDEECEIPNGLTPLQYADWVMEKAVIVSGFGLRDRFARTVSAICKLETVDGPEASKRLLQRVVAAQLAGETINTFWIDDSRWKPQRARASPATLGMRAGASEPTEAEAYVEWESMSAKFKLANPWKRGADVEAQI